MIGNAPINPKPRPSRAKPKPVAPAIGPLESPPVTPFNSVPGRAPVPAPEPEPAAEREPGFLESTLRLELESLTTHHPAARTLAGSALLVARAADLADPADLKAVLSANKELRAVLADLAKARPPAGGDSVGDSDSTFGPVRPEVVHPPAV